MYNVGLHLSYHHFTAHYIIADSEEKAVEAYTSQMKERFKESYIPESQWPPLFTPNFTSLGYTVYKSERTTQDTQKHAKLARLGTLPEEVTVDEEISNIFLPIDSNKLPQIILIEGAPGIGKTMLMREIVYLWANEKILTEKKNLLCFPLRDPKINKWKHIEDMFYYSCQDEEDAKIYAKYFKRNSGSGLVILLDGLDENPQAMRMQIGTFFYDILIEQKIFKEACIVITS